MKPELRQPLVLALALLVALGAIAVGKTVQAGHELDRERARILELGVRLDALAARRADVASLRSRTGTEADLRRDRAALAAQALARSEVPALVARLRAVARRHALGSFDADRAVRSMESAVPSSRLARVDVQVEVATDWPRLGALLADVRALEPRVALEEITIHRAEEVPLLGARLVVAALVAEDGAKLAAALPATIRFGGPNPFFLASELASGRSRRLAAAAWTPPPVELEGVIYSKGSSHVIVNGRAVREGRTFTAGSEVVKVLEVFPESARFQVGERIFERGLPAEGGRK